MAKQTTKGEMLGRWMAFRKRINPLRFMQPIAYKATGSSYGACGIRIDGNPEFIDAVLSQLTDLLDGENTLTRLELSRSEVDFSKVKADGSKAGAGAEVCYIRLHKRGGEGAMLQSLISPSGNAAAERMLDLWAEPTQEKTQC